MVKTNQFSVTRHEKVANGLIGDQGLPGVFVLYELSPMMVKFTEKHRSVTAPLNTLLTLSVTSRSYTSWKTVS